MVVRLRWLDGRVTWQVPTCTEPEDRGGRSGVTVYIDANNNNQPDDGEVRTITDANGNYTLGPLGAGTYIVRMVVPAGATAIGSTSAEIVQNTPTFTVTGINFRLQFPPDQPLNCIPDVNDGPEDLLPVFPGIVPPVIINDLGGKIQLLASSLGVNGVNGNLLAHAAFVTGVYSGILNRQPDPGGLVTWVQQLQGGLARSQVVAAIWNSVEHRELQVEYYYATFLGRAADPGGKAVWVNALLAGMPEEQLLSSFLGSAEYFAQSNSDNSIYVARLYAQVLGRKAEAGGFAAWVQELDSGGSRVTVASSFVQSREASNRVLDLLYKNYLGRAVDPVGQEAWLTALGSGQTDWSGVAQAILSSDEYYAKLLALAQSS